MQFLLQTSEYRSIENPLDAGTLESCADLSIVCFSVSVSFRLIVLAPWEFSSNPFFKNKIPVVDVFFLLCRMLHLQAFWKTLATLSSHSARKSQSFPDRNSNLSPRDVKIFIPV